MTWHCGRSPNRKAERNTTTQKTVFTQLCERTFYYILLYRNNTTCSLLLCTTERCKINQCTKAFPRFCLITVEHACVASTKSLITFKTQNHSSHIVCSVHTLYMRSMYNVATH